MSAEANELEASLEQLLESFHQVGSLLSDFRPENQTRLVDSVGGLAPKLDRLAAAAAAPSVAAVRVPRRLFDFLDSGSNPDLLTQQTLAAVVAASEQCKGKLAALGDFHEQLAREAVEVFPELAEEMASAKKEEEEPVAKKNKNE